MTATTASDAAHISPGEFTQIDFSRVDTRLHPIQAWRAFRRLMASPGDTRQVFAIFRALRGLPDGSVGRAYLAFMEEENLSADGLVEASRTADWDTDVVPPEMDFFRRRMRDSHDLTHILTGYGRDPLGELCLLAFRYRHTRNLGMAFMVAMSWPRVPEIAKAAVKEGWRNGAKATWFQNLDFEALLGRNLAEVRAELGIAPPKAYQALRTPAYSAMTTAA